MRGFLTRPKDNQTIVQEVTEAVKIPEQAPGHLIEPPRCEFPSTLFISAVAASVSEWKSIHSLTLAATPQASRSQLRGIKPVAHEANGRSTKRPVPFPPFAPVRSKEIVAGE